MPPASPSLSLPAAVALRRQSAYEASLSDSAARQADLLRALDMAACWSEGTARKLGLAYYCDQEYGRLVAVVD